MENKFCIECGAKLVGREESITKPTWKLAWGLLWRIWLITIPLALVLSAIVNTILK